MTNEIAYNFLYNTNEFKEQFQRVLNRTPRERNAGKVDFWIHFCSSIGLTIQNTRLNSDSIHVKDIAFSIENIPNSKTKILKLAFKVNADGQNKVILRSISIGEDNVPGNIQYSNTELTAIEKQFWGNHARQTAGITIALVNVDSQSLHLNIKTSKIELQDNSSNNATPTKSHFVKVQPLQEMQAGQQSNVVLDAALDLIAIPEPTTQNSQATFVKNVKAFYQQLIDLYNTNQQQVLLKSEVAYHGFIYGVLALNYRNKYAIDIYVEQSAGRGFLDLYFLLRKDKWGKNILNSVKVITELKGNGNIYSITDAENQMDGKAYDHLLGRSNAQKVVKVATDFGSVLEKVEVVLQAIAAPTQDFISMLIRKRQVALNQNRIKQELKYIYDSTRSDELLDRVILGELLSSDAKKINVFVIQNIPDNHRVSMFVFENQNQEAVILTIIERENLNPLTYDRRLLKDPSKPATRDNIVKTRKVTIEEETREAILHIQGELNISAASSLSSQRLALEIKCDASTKILLDNLCLPASSFPGMLYSLVLLSIIIFLTVMALHLLKRPILSLYSKCVRPKSHLRFTASSAKPNLTSPLDPEEVKKFDNDDWWSGTNLLQAYNSVRVPLVRDGILSVAKKYQKAASPLAGYRILDVGCGGGLLSEPLARLGAEVTGLEPSSRSIEIAREHSSRDPEISGRLTYICDTVENLAAPNSDFDAVVCSEVVEHVNDVQSFVGSCVELTKTGGSLFFTTINRTNISYCLSIVMAEYVLGMLPRGTHDWNKFVKPEELTGMLESLNCRVVSVEGVAFNPISKQFVWCGSRENLYALHAVKL